MTIARLTLVVSALLCGIPTHQATAGTASPDRSKTSGATKARRKARCRDIFCTAHHVVLDASGGADKNALTAFLATL